MMKDRIKKDSVEALKAGDKKKVEVLRYLISLIDKKELLMPTGQMTDEDVMVVLLKELKNKKEVMEMFAKGGRQDLVDDTRAEIEIMSVYLPEEVSEDEIETKVKEVVAQIGDNFGAVMGKVMAEFKGRVDGAVVSRIVNQVLKNE